jgi:hypothetical protein
MLLSLRVSSKIKFSRSSTSHSMRLVAILICYLLVLKEADASCKIHDASWKSNGPLVTQPNRAAPEKVTVNWSTIIINARCVDFYNVWAWRNGQPKERGINITIMDKAAVKADITIEPCVDYNFAVEFVERDWTHTGKETSQPRRFRSEAIPAFNNQDKSNFVVTYAYDPVKQMQTMDKATIRFRKEVIRHASCIKHIEVTGNEDTTIGNNVGGSSQTGRSMGFRQRVVGGSSSSGGGSSYRPGGSSYNPGGSSYNPGGSSYNPGGSSYNPGGSSYNPGGSSYNPGGSSYNPGGSSYNPGGSSYNPGGSHHNPGGSSYNPGGSNNNPGGSSYNPGGNNWSSGSHVRPDNANSYRDPNCPPGGQSSTGYNPNPNCYRGNQNLYPDHGHGHGQTSRPPYNQGGGLDWNNNNNNNNHHGRYKRERITPNTNRWTTSKPIHGSSNRVQHQVEPPFNAGDYIEVTFPVTACKPYRFTLKIVTRSNNVIGEIKDLILPKLADMHDFHPPPLAKVFRIENPTNPKLVLNPAMGIPATCLSDFLQAVDNRMNYLEVDLQFHVQQERMAHGQGQYLSQQVLHQQSNRLAEFGCKCNATNVKVTGTSVTKYNMTMGVYNFEGMNQVSH